MGDVLRRPRQRGLSPSAATIDSVISHLQAVVRRYLTEPSRPDPGEVQAWLNELVHTVERAHALLSSADLPLYAADEVAELAQGLFTDGWPAWSSKGYRNTRRSCWTASANIAG